MVPSSFEHSKRNKTQFTKNGDGPLSENIVAHSFLQVFCKFSTGFLLVRVGWPPSLLVWLCILHLFLFACIPMLLGFAFVYIVPLGLLWHVLAWMVDGWRLRLVKTCKKLDTSKLVKNVVLEN